MQNSTFIHNSALIPSRIDVRELGAAVESRFLDVCELHLRTTGVEVFPPESLDSAMQLWRTMRVRHNSGDFRHRPDEYKATQEIAQWTWDVKSKLTGKPLGKIPWKD